jgi:crotonobetainyl-CoA:carnitine CoA-transferase CaiB-like acyl-CoA transferase
MSGALEGLKVLDLTRNAPGPFCCMVLADYGADVIQIADPGYFAAQTKTGTPYADLRGAEHDALSRNKRSLGLNLKSEDGQRIFHALARAADVVVVEWRPGVAERLNVGFSVLSQLNRKLIYCAISGYGQNGPKSRLAGHDLNYLAWSGVLSLMTDRTGRPIVPPNIIADFGAGLLAAFAILAAVTARSRTGEGQFIDASLCAGTQYLATDFISLVLANLDRPHGGGWTVTGGLPFYDVYGTKDGKYLTIAAFEDRFFRRLCQRIDCGEFSDAQWRRDRYEAMRHAFAMAFRRRTAADWLDYLKDDDVCVAPVVEFADAARELHRSKEIDAQVILDGPPLLSLTPARLRSAPVLPFAHSDTILGEMGWSPEEIDRLRSNGAIR